MRIKRSRKAGMTLLELMVASGMLTLAMSMIFGSLMSISVVGNLSENRVDAVNAVSSVLEQVRQQSYEQILNFTPPELTCPGVRRTVTLECYNSAGTAIPLPLGESQSLPSLPNPLEVKATLIWEDESGRVYSKYSTTSVGR